MPSGWWDRVGEGFDFFVFLSKIYPLFFKVWDELETSCFISNSGCCVTRPELESMTAQQQTGSCCFFSLSFQKPSILPKCFLPSGMEKKIKRAKEHELIASWSSTRGLSLHIRETVGRLNCPHSVTLETLTPRKS